MLATAIERASSVCCTGIRERAAVNGHDATFAYAHGSTTVLSVSVGEIGGSNADY